jgi:hypothetical protein
MKYLLLIYENEKAWAALSKAEMGAIFGEYSQLTSELRQSSKLLGGDGKTTVTDGPFAETKEQLGGFYLIEAADLDDALKIAARIPAARGGAIEVRPVMARP